MCIKQRVLVFHQIFLVVYDVYACSINLSLIQTNILLSLAPPLAELVARDDFILSPTF